MSASGAGRPAAGGYFGKVWGQTFLAFQVRDFRFLWANLLITGMGMSIAMIAQGWLVLDLTNSSGWVGVVAAVRGTGQLSMGLMGGVIADRVDRRRLIIAVQMSMATLVLVTGVLVVTDLIRVWQIMIIVLLEGMIFAVNMPARTSFTYDLVGPRAVLNATAANFSAFNISRIAGPAAGGLVIASLGTGTGFLIGAATYVLALPLLLRVASRPRHISTDRSVLADLREGVSYALDNRPLRAVLVMSVLTETFGFAYIHMMPVFARDVLDVGPSGLGFLSTAGGVGALVATISVASLGDYKHRGWLLVAMAFGFGVAIVLFALSPWFALSLVLVGLVGATGTAYDSLMATVVQTIAPDHLRGRMMGLLGLTFGMNPIGGLIAGVSGTAIGVPRAISFCGGVVMLYALRMTSLAPRLQSGAANEAAAQPILSDDIQDAKEHA